MNDDRIPYYSVSVHPSRINVYYQTLLPSKFPRERSQVPHNFRSNSHRGRISSVAKRKISKSIDYMIFLAKPKKVYSEMHGKDYTFKLNFITLTLSAMQAHSDQKIKAVLLNQFFIEMARKWKVPTYIWRAEKQKNGNIHFHIITGKFIPWNELRNVWNRIQQKLGYVTAYRNDRVLWHRQGFKFDQSKSKTWGYSAQLKAYKSGLRTDWDNPNSTDVHSIRHVGNISRYFIKYMTKTSQPIKIFSGKKQCPLCGNPMHLKDGIIQCQTCLHSTSHVFGRLWSCSVNLSHLSGGRTDVDSKIENELERIFKHKTAWVIHKQYYSCYIIDFNVVRALGCDQLLACFEAYIRMKFPDLVPSTLF